MNKKMQVLSLVLAAAALSCPVGAHAGWTALARSGGAYDNLAWARACKQAENGAYGPVWKITLQAQRNNTIPKDIRVRIHNPRADNYVTAEVVNPQWLYGVVAGVEIYTSSLPDHYHRVSFASFTNASSGNWLGWSYPIHPGSLANC